MIYVWFVGNDGNIFYVWDSYAEQEWTYVITNKVNTVIYRKCYYSLKSYFCNINVVFSAAITLVFSSQYPSVGDTSFPAQSSTWLHRYYLHWTKLDNAITKFNNEMHSADNWVLNPVILHYWQNLPILILCSALLQFVLLKALYK